MHAIKPPINPYDFGPQVADLYSALHFLVEKGVFKRISPTRLKQLHDQMLSEQPSATYKGAAVALVKRFQTQMRLGAVGVVDQKTAAALNRRLKALDVLFEVEPPGDDAVDVEPYKVSGTVTDTAGLPRSGLKVVAYDRDLRRHHRLGDASTDAVGRYEIGYKREAFLRSEATAPLAADLFVVVLLDDGLEPLATSDTRFNAKPVEIIDVVVHTTDIGPSEFERVTALVMPLLVGQGMPREVLTSAAEQIPTNLQPHELNAEDLEFIVRETGLEWAAVQAWAESARLLNDARQLQPQDASGGERSSLNSLGWPFFFGWCRASLPFDLAGVLRADPDQWETSLRISQVRSWISPVSKDDASALLGALERLSSVARLDPVLAGDPLFAAIGAQSTGLPPEMVVKALTIYREDGIESLADIYQLGDADPILERGLGVISTALRVYEVADGNTALIQPIMRRLVNLVAGIEPLTEMSVGELTKLVMETGAGEAAAQDKAVVLQLKLEQLHPTKALQARVASDAITFDGYSQQELTDLLQSNIKAIDQLLSGDELDSADPFGTAYPELTNQIRDLGQWVKAGAGFAAGQDLTKRGLRPGNITKYGTTVIDTILGKYPPAIQNIIAAHIDKFHGDLNKIIREGYWGINRPPLFDIEHGRRRTPQIDPLPPPVPAISAPTIRGIFGDLDDCICQPCESVLGQGAYLVDLLNLLQREVLLPGAPDSEVRTGIHLLRARRPDILDLELSCENTEVLLPHIDLALEALEWQVASAQLTYGPGNAQAITAWFTPQLDRNLLALLQQTSSAPLGSLRSFVDADNPRLWRVKDRDRTWLIEALPLDGSPGQAQEFKLIGLSVRRSKASPDPRIEPTYRIPSAYGILGDVAAVFPWNLPFDLGAAEGGLYQERLQLPRLRLLELSAIGTSTTRINEVLGLTSAERGLLETSRTADELWQAWGFTNATPIASFVDPESAEVLPNQTPQQLLQRASVLLARCGLDLPELERVLATRFVGTFTLSRREQCKTSLMRVRPAMAPDAFDRLHRFLRLWRKLPEWSIEILDSVLVALNPVPAPATHSIDQDVLAGIASVQEISSLLALPVAHAIGLRAPLSSVASRASGSQRSVTLFADVFLSNRAGTESQGLFTQVASPGTSVVNRLDQNLDALAAALRVAPQLLAQALPILTSVLGDADAISHDTLTWLYRHVTLARALGVSVLELRLLFELTAREPLGPTEPPFNINSANHVTGFASLLAIVKAAAKVNESELSISLLADAFLPSSHVLRPVMKRADELKPEKQIVSELNELRKEMGEAVPVSDTELEAQLQQVRSALSRFMSSDIATDMVATLGNPQATVAPRLVDALSGASIVGQDPFGIGLLTPAEASSLLTKPLSQLSLADKLTQVLSASGALSRRLTLARVLKSWTALTDDALNQLLRDGLRIRSGAGGDALSVLAHQDFWSRDEAVPLDAEIVTWAKRLDRLMALFKGRDPSLAMTMLSVSNWETLILPAVASNSWHALERILDLRWLTQPLQIGEAVLRAHVAALAAPGASANLSTAIVPLARRLKLAPAEALEAWVHTATGAATVTSLLGPGDLRCVTELAELARPLGATMGQLSVFAGTDTAQFVRTARQLLAARVGTEAWPALLTGISDTLRKLQRDALVAYLLHKTPNLVDANSLYEHLLIDPQIQPCFLTTRITQAVSSVQLLIQRILFGLEPSAVVSAALRDRWSWMRSYRLWEANRKVFLYPENWLFPELRDDKSPAFRRLEATLGEGELTQERASQAFGQFIEEINQVAQTEVLSLFEDVDALDTAAGQQRTRRDLVLVGRSPNPPYRYHWRHCREFGKKWMEWSPWERIELDIQGDHVMPFVVNGRVHVAWPIIHKEASKNHGIIERWRIELAWSAFDGMAWQKVSSSRDNAPSLNRTAFEDERSGLAFRPYVSRGGSQPILYAYLKDAAASSTVTLEQTPPNGDVQITDAIPPRLLNRMGAGELARLLVATVEEFKQASADFFDVMQLYCYVWQNPNTPILGYAGLPKRDIFFNPDTLRYHRWERDRGASIFVNAVTFPQQSLKNFIEDYRDLSGYGAPSYGVGLWTTNPFVELVKAILSNCSARQLQFRAWARVSSNANDLLELTSADGAFNLTVSGLSQTIVLSPGGAPSEPMIVAGATEGGASHTATLAWTPLGHSVTLTASLSLDAVDKGKSVTQTLHYLILDTNNQSGLASRLLTPRPFKNVQRFILQPNGAMTTEESDRSVSLEPLDTSSDVWMNGYKELVTLGQSFGLTLPKESSLVPVFRTSRANQRYRVVGASAAGAVALNQTSLWYFNEQASSCLIDVSPEPTAVASRSGISIYPNAWLQGDSLSRMWSEAGRLPSGGAQSDDFGTNLLPALSTGMQAGLPSEVKQGQWLFDNRLPNAGYNWEIYFHAPLLIADQLSKQQRFEDAERWLSMVFDPNSVEPGLTQSFLRFRVFREMPRGLSVANDLKSLAKAVGSSSTPYVESISALIARWRNQPFRPFVIARRRQVAFLWRTVFAYLDNLLAWADSLYRRDTRETIAEAAQLYILAARILGPKPRVSSAHRTQNASSYTDLSQKWDDFANAWFGVNTPATTQPAPPLVGGVAATDQPPAPEGFLFFCIPVNDKLNTYWDLVNERLFNIRHCRNLEGIARDLPLTDPTIDPELLVRATAAGLEINEVVNNLFARPFPYRYSVLAARALDLASDLKIFGSALLSALEKRDSEKLGQLRSKNELDLLNRVSAVRTLQIKEAELNLEALRVSRAASAGRYEQIQRQLGVADKRAPKEHETIGEESQLGRLASGGTLATSKWGLINEEQRQLEEQSTAGFWTDADSVARVVGAAFSSSASIAHAFSLDSPGKALSALASAGGATADSFRAISQIHQTLASRQAASASHIRRRDEWAYQANQLLRELRQIDKQILANEIRMALTRAELANHKAQIDQSQEIDFYLREKFTNEELYDWISSQLSSLHSTAFSMALDMARRAERAAEHELGVSSFNFIGNGYSNDRRSSLLVGERLHQDIKRLEIAYLEHNRREYEITKHVSLRRLNPLELLKLKTNGSCDFEVPEWLFDMDMPGQYMRRIKSISVSIPCVVGPYTSVNCKLTLKKNIVRHSSTSSGPYESNSQHDDPRFTVNYGAAESIVTSTGRDDSGLFETALRDERYLPFECAGAISSWKLELPSKPKQFDFDTISDVILHIRYTAREGGESLKEAAIKQFLPPSSKLTEPIKGYPVLLSCRSEFANEWAAATAYSTEHLKIKLDSTLLPYWNQSLGHKILRVSSFKCPKDWQQSDRVSFEQIYSADVNRTTTLPLPSNGEIDLGAVSSVLVEDVFVLLNVGY